jgi:hypothetical protein
VAVCGESSRLGKTGGDEDRVGALGPQCRVVTLTADISDLGPGTVTVFAGTDSTADPAGTVEVPRASPTHS